MEWYLCESENLNTENENDVNTIVLQSVPKMQPIWELEKVSLWLYCYLLTQSGHYIIVWQLSTDFKLDLNFDFTNVPVRFYSWILHSFENLSADRL